MTLAQLRKAVRDAMEDHKLTIAELARELAPFYRPDTVYKYLRPGFTRTRPQARFVHLAGEALAGLIARQGGRAAA